MHLQGSSWRNREIRQHVRVIDGIEQPTLILTNATYLNVFTKEWLQANIWIYKDRVVYVGENLPIRTDGTQIYDCKGKYIVPGYVEPHSHPFLIANPEVLASHAASFGTTALINDNLMWHFLLDKKKAFSLIEEFHRHPVSMYWWARYDSQTALADEEQFFNSEDVLEWIEHPSVVQGGELTGWPSLLEGNDRLLYWIQETKRQRKPVEGHLPGASEKTLTKLKLLGISADHEPITGEEVMRRLRLGYHVSLRYSSIRPDLPQLVEDLLAQKVKNFDHLSFTTDGATPHFLEKGMINQCIAIAIQKGVPLEDAYCMGSLNAARHFHLDEHLGSIAPGRIAHINILDEKDNPNPASVIAKGEWVKKEGENQEISFTIDWEKYGIKPIPFDWELKEDDLQFSMPIGLDMVNNVIVKPYTCDLDVTAEHLSNENKEAYLVLMDRKGKWRVNTTIRGFTKELGAIASSFSSSGDIIFIGKSKKDMLLAWKRLKEIGGGIVLVHRGDILLEIPLELGGIMSKSSMSEVIAKEKQLIASLQKFGYPYGDPIYTLLFLSATHLPYIRITQQGIIDIMKKEILFPATMC